MIDQYPSPNGVLTSLIWRKTAAGGETSLSGYDNASQALSYTPGQEQVYLNGILLVRGDDYTATNGTSITGLAALAANDFVQINCYNNFSVATTPATSITGTIANNQLQNSSITINGSAVSLGGSTTIGGGSAQDDAPSTPVEGQLWLDTNGTTTAAAFVEKGIVNAKGDLYVGTADNTVGILSSGNAGDTLVADSSATTGLRYNPPVASLANPIINGGADIWQRGTSIAGIDGVGAYTADRWWWNVGSAGTVSRQTTGDTTNLPNIQYCLRAQRNNGQGATGSYPLDYNLETTNSIPFAGKAVTLSFYARKGANYSPTNDLLPVALYSGTGTDQKYSAGFTGVATVASANVTLTSTWQRFVITGTVGATATQLAIRFNMTTTGTAGAADFYELTGVQLDVGTWTASTAPTFRRSGGTLAGERSACMRYYQRFNSDQVYAIYASGPARSTTQADFLVPFLVPLRTSPSSTIDYANLAMNGYNGDTVRTVTALVENSINKSPFAAVVTATHTGTNFTQGNIYRLFNDNNASGYLGFSAEL